MDVSALLRADGAADPVLMGVEAKLSSWARAVAQAALNRYAVDVSYIAIPLGRTSYAVLNEAARHGVGVLSVSQRRVDVALAASVNQPDPALRARVLAQLDPVRPRAWQPISELTAQAEATVRGAPGAA